MILEFIFEFIVVWLLSYPGAFIRWAIFGFKKGKFRDYFLSDSYINMFVFSVFILFVVLCYRFLI